MSEQEDSSPAQKAAQSLQNLTGPLSSSLSNLSSSSRSIPSNQDFHFFHNFQDFNGPIQEIATQSESLLQSIGSSQIFNQPIAFPDAADITDAYDWLVDVNDEVFERMDVSMDEFNKKRGEDGEGRNDGGFQMVYGKNKKKGGSAGGGADSVSLRKSRGDTVNVKVKEKKEKSKVSFHIPTIKRPQEEYNILVNNANQPFEHVWLRRSEDGQRFIHPLESHSVLDFVDKVIEDAEPVKPPSIEQTPFKLVEEVKDLKELAAKLKSVNEFAVDLEHNQYRSFQGLTCLMQISTRTEDFVVDTLKLRIHVGPYLREVFKDPTKKKVMHGADRDIVWLQRDFGIYLCNMFDTGQASRVLKLERNSLEYLLRHYCGVTANKEYQNADWRLRPLPDEMLRYAREDTHYLLYIYDIMKTKLSLMPKESENSDAPLTEVYKRSYDICMQLYEKELLTENSYLYIYGLQGAGLNAQQLAVVAGLCQWRDIVARAEDESTGYVLPNKTLIEIAKQMPSTANKLRRLLKSKHPYIERNLSSVVSIIRHSIQNAADYEAIAQQLKEGRMEVASEETLTANDESEVLFPDTLPNSKIANVGRGVDGANALVELARHKIGSFEPPGGVIAEETKESGSHTSELPIYGQSRDMNASCSGKVTGATVHALKKPSRGFGALLGKPKRKFGSENQDKDEVKLEQIRSSVNLPFHSTFTRDEQLQQVDAIEFESNKSEQTKSIVEESGGVLEAPQSKEPPAIPSARSDTEDIIFLEDNTNEDEEPAHGNLETKNVASEDNSASLGSDVEMDKQDETMSLSDLSNSFQQCFHATKKPEKPEKSEEPSGLLQLKPFDFETARKQIKFGLDAVEESARVDGNKKKPLNSGEKKKVSAADQAQKDDGTRELSQGRRRFAFPATGNRSATFR
ncbi:protein RRP6-like 2 [Melia azedarach]|uniref:Protein RRP6-like 2 n=1 Tax=Melia azedarach TaxID=155640 RepID=A0ACC1YF85_MELAZ|nr:protein RRP6-like 2 [Melia azedarach]